MPFLLSMPKLSPTMEVGTIVKWHKKEGDEVKSGDLLFEVATDKATVEHTALDEGFIRKIMVPEGEDASVNDPLAIMTEDATEDISNFELPAKKPVAENVEESSTADAKDDATEKEPAAKASSAAIYKPQFQPAAPLENYQFNRPTGHADTKLKASPLARKLAREKSLDISSVKGTGPGGRVVADDLKLAEPLKAGQNSSRAVPQETAGSYTEQKLSPMRKVIGKRLQESKSFIPHFYVTNKVNVAALIDIREQLISAGLKFSVNDFVVKATAIALKAHPEVNTGYNSVSDSLIQFLTIDIAIAVSMEDGLITPIIRHTDYKKIGEISAEVKDLAKRARSGKLAPQEYQGGSFTISNLGMYGVSHFQAIINPPQAAILSVGAACIEPVVKNGVIMPGQIMEMTLSVDHRVIDGAVAASFLQTLKSILEAPAQILL